MGSEFWFFRMQRAEGRGAGACQCEDSVPWGQARGK